jgi:predicted DNA-binding transcriptional regulator YafY
MAEKYETSLSSIGRDIAFMKDMLNAPIEYCAQNRGFFYSEPSYRIPAGFSGAEDLLALGMAKSILTLYQDTPLYDAAKTLLDCITAPLSAEGKEDWYENRIIVPQIPSAAVNPEIWKIITDGLKENRFINFEYKGSWDEEFKLRLVRPYQLLFDNGMWYLYGFSEERKAIRIFSLSRMRHLSLLSEQFALPENFDYRKTSNTSYFGVFAGQEIYEFSIAFYDESALWVQERLWADDQKVEDADDGVIVTFSSSQYNKVLEWMLSRGCTAQPYAPEKLVNDWKHQIKEMVKLTEN